MSEAIESNESNPVPEKLSDFLSAQRSRYLEAVEQGGTQRDVWTISMGNKAGDLDSLVCAVAYAWYATRRLGQPTVPLLQTSRADLLLPLRTENLYALEFSGVNPAHLLVGDELPSGSPPAMKYALLDHNVLEGRFAADQDARVVAIVDHHEDERQHLDASPRIIQVPTGSCASLVAQLIRQEWPEGMSRELARLLLCAVLIDTDGLKSGGEAQDADREVAPFLLEKAGLRSTSERPVEDVRKVKEVKELDQTLDIRKASVDHLSPRDLLRRDYKDYRYVPAWNAEGTVLVGLATVPKGIEAITRGDKDGGRELATVCIAWLKESELDALGVLTSWKDEGKDGKKKKRREMVWVVRGEDELEDRLWKGLEASKELDLERKGNREDVAGMEEAGGKDLKIRMYEQRNAQASRKVTAPVIRTIIEER